MSTLVTQDAARLVTPTLEELKASRYDSPNIQAALEGLHQDGFVVLKSVVDVGHLEQLTARMSEEADQLLRDNAKPFNQGVKCRVLIHGKLLAVVILDCADDWLANILQAPPLTDGQYLHNDVFFNPFVIQVMNAYVCQLPAIELNP